MTLLVGFTEKRLSFFMLTLNTVSVLKAWVVSGLEKRTAVSDVVRKCSVVLSL